MMHGEMEIDGGYCGIGPFLRIAGMQIQDTVSLRLSAAFMQQLHM